MVPIGKQLASSLAFGYWLFSTSCVVFFQFNKPIVFHVLRTVPPAYYAHLAAFRARHYMDDGLSDQGSSSAASSRPHDHAVLVKQLPKVKENVRQFMFYC